MKYDKVCKVRCGKVIKAVMSTVTMDMLENILIL